MRRINDDRQVGFAFEHRHTSDVHHIAVGGFKCADAAFAENNIVIATRCNVFSRHEPFGNGGGQAALEDHRFVDASHFFQQIKILHVARADLDNVDIMFEKGVEHAQIHQFGDNRQVVFISRLTEYGQTSDAFALKGVGTGARFESTAAQQTATGCRDLLRGQIDNVGLSDANLPKVELCQRIKKRVPDFTFLEAPLGQDPDKRNYVVSNAKLEKTGFKLAHSLDDGVAELVKGYAMVRNARYGNV